MKLVYNVLMEKFKQFLDMGINDFHDGHFRSAIESLNQAIEIDKNSDLAYFFRGACYHSLEEYDEAMLDYTKSISLNPNMPDAYYNRAKIILSRKDIKNPDIKQAVNDLEKALAIDNNFVDAMYAMAAAYKKLGDYHKTLEYLEQLLQISPDHIYARALKKLILQKYII